MIRIELHDLTKSDAPTLYALSEVFNKLSNSLTDAAIPANLKARIDEIKHTTATSAAVIAPEDAPDAGSPSAAEAFATPAAPVSEAAAVFGGNAPAASLPTASAPVNAAANAPVTSHVPAPSGADLDVDGLPWDARIHASSKVKNADGRWRGRRGVEDSVVATVTAELRAVLGNAPAVASPAVPAPVVTQTVTIPAPPHVAQVEAGNVPSIPAVPAAPVAVASTIDAGNVPLPPTIGAPAVSTATPIAPVASPQTVMPVQTAPAPSVTFPQLCAKITAALNGGTLTQEHLAGVLAQNALASLPTLAAFPDKVQPVAAALGFA